MHEDQNGPPRHRGKEDVEVERWQLDEIRAVLAAAEQGEFATEDEVRALFERWLGPV